MTVDLPDIRPMYGTKRANLRAEHGTEQGWLEGCRCAPCRRGAQRAAHNRAQRRSDAMRRPWPRRAS